MAETLEILVVAKDKASSTFKSIGNSMSSAFKVASIGAGVGLGAIGVGLAGIITLGMEGERVQAQLNNVIKSTGGVAGVTADEANALADSLSRVTKFSADTVIETESMLLTFTNIGGNVMPRATETVLDMATALGTDTQGAAVQLGKALNDPINGITALSRVGVTFTEEQKEQIKAMVEAGDVAGAQAVILDELGREFGNSARAAGDTFGGKLTILKNKLIDVFETIGMKMMPALSGLADVLIDNVLPKVEQFGAKYEKLFWYLGIIVKTFVETITSGDGIIPAFQWMFTTFEDGSSVLRSLFVFMGVGSEQADKLANSINGVVGPFLTFIDETVVPLVNEYLPDLKKGFMALAAVFAGAAIGGAILAIGSAIAALAVPLAIVASVSLISAAWRKDWGGIRSFLTPILKSLQVWFAKNIPKAMESLNRAWQAMGDVWEEDLKPALQDLQVWLSEQIPLAVEAMGEVWTNTLMPAFEDLQDFWNDTLEPMLIDLANWFAEQIPLAIEAYVDVWTNVLIPALQTLIVFWNDTLKPILGDIVAWFVENIPIALEALKTAWNEKLMPALQDLKDFWDTTLQPALSDIVTWFTTNIPIALEALKTAWDEKLMPALQDLKDFWDTTLQPVLSDIVDWLETNIPVAIDALKSFVDETLLPAFQSIVDFWNDTLKPALTWIVSFIAGLLVIAIAVAYKAITEVFLPAFNDVVDFWNDTLKPVFEAIIDHIEVKISEAIDVAQDAFENILKPAMETIVSYWTDNLKPVVDAISARLGMGLVIALSLGRAAIDAIKGAIEALMKPINDVIGGVEDMANGISGLGSAVPWEWLPGSPTPLEIGWRGIASSMRDIDSAASATGSGLGRSLGQLSALGQGGQTNYNLTINSNAQTENLRNDFNTMRVWGGLN
jgi:hypothetical protein